MTVATTSAVKRFTATVGQTLFSVVTFGAKSASDIQVLVDNTPKVLNTDYQITSLTAVSFNVDFSISAAPGAGKVVTVRLNLPLTQETDYLDNDPFPAETHESALDKLTRITQQIQEQVDRSLKFPRPEDTPSELAVKATRALKFLSFDVNGNPTVSTGTDAVRATVIEQKTATAGQTVFTVNTAYTLGINALTVYSNGLRLRLGVDYTETTANSFTLTVPATLGQEFDVVINTGNALAGQTDAANVSYTPAGTGAVVRNVKARLDDVVNVKNFGAVGDGVANDLPALINAHAQSGSVYFPKGTYRISGNWSPVAADFIFAKGASISIDSGITLTFDTKAHIHAGRHQIFSGSGTVNKYPDIGFPEWFGAIADNSTDSASAIQKCLNACAGAHLSGQQGQFPQNRYKVGSQIIIPDNKSLFGDSINSVWLVAISGTFPINTPVILMGPDSSGDLFGIRIQRLTIDCNHIAGSTGIKNVAAQEGSTIESVAITNFGLYGIHTTIGTNSSSGNYPIRDVWILISKEASTANSRCIYAKSGNRAGTYYDRVTVAASTDGTNIWNVKPNHFIEVDGQNSTFHHLNVEAEDAQISAIYLTGFSETTWIQVHSQGDPPIFMFIDGTGPTPAKGTTILGLTNRDRTGNNLTIRDDTLGTAFTLKEAEIPFYSTLARAGGLALGDISPFAFPSRFHVAGVGENLAWFEHTDAGATAGPVINLWRNSASPAINDLIGEIKFLGETSTSAQFPFASIKAEVLDPTNGAEDGQLLFSTGQAGNVFVRAKLRQGLQMGSPTGGDKGSGTINVATDVFKNNSAYLNPDYALEHYYTGKIEKFKDNPGAEKYQGLMSLDDLAQYTRKHWHLPNVPREDGIGIFERGDIALEKIEELTLYILELKREIDALKSDKKGKSK